MVSDNLISLTPSCPFTPSLHFSLTTLTWPAVEKLLVPVTKLTNSMLASFELSIFLCADVTGFCRPRPDFLTGIIRKVPMLGGGGGMSFQIRRKARRVWREVSTLLRRQIPYPLSSVAGISILIGSRRKWLRRSPVDI